MSDLTLICHACKFPIGDGKGWLRVLFADINAYRQKGAEWGYRNPEGSAMSLEDLLGAPDPIHWRAYHAKCDPEMAQDAYYIDAERIRTWPQLVRWTAHLMGKNWFQFTDWEALLWEAAGESPGPAVTIRQVVSA